MKNTLVLLGFLTIYFHSLAQWQQLGPSNLSNDVTDNVSMDTDNSGVIYTAYKPFTDNFLYVKRYVGGNWVQVGGSASSDPVGEANMVVGTDGLPVVVYRKYNDSLVVRKFDGTDWQTIGSGPFAKGDYPRIEVNSANVIHVVFNNKAIFPWGTSVFKFEAGSWGPLHTQYVENLQSSFTDIAFDSNDHPIVSFRRESTGQMSVFRSNGTNWQLAGNPQFTPPGAYFGRLSIDNLDVPYVTFSVLSSNNAGSVMYLNGSTWSYLGVPDFTIDAVNYTPLVFDQSNIPYVVLQNGSTKLMRYESSSWQQVDLSPGMGSDHDLLFNQYGNPVVAYTDMYQNYNLVVKQLCSPVSTNQTISICNGDIYEIGGQEFTATGNYQVTLTRVSGCDSLVNLDLNVLPEITSSQSVSICSGETFLVGTASHSISGIYTDILQASNGCDSIVTTQLTVISPITFLQTVTLCYGETLQVGTTVLSSSGTYSTVLEAISGCDSIVTTVLTIDNPLSYSQSFSICSGEVIQVGSSIYNTSGTYTDVLVAQNGCDSIITTVLYVTDDILTNQLITLCSGESVQIGTSIYTVSGTYTDVLTAIGGCDSTVITTVNVQTPLVTTISILTSTLIADQTGATYQWIDCSTQNPINGATEQSYSPTQSGEYGVEITFEGCSAVSECISMELSGIDQMKSSYKIYPNPTDGKLIVDAVACDHIRVLDLSGRVLIDEHNFNGLYKQLDLSSLKSGKYMVELLAGEAINEWSFIVKL